MRSWQTWVPSLSQGSGEHWSGSSESGGRRTTALSWSWPAGWSSHKAGRAPDGRTEPPPLRRRGHRTGCPGPWLSPGNSGQRGGSGRPSTGQRWGQRRRGAGLAGPQELRPPGSKAAGPWAAHRPARKMQTILHPGGRVHPPTLTDRNPLQHSLHSPQGCGRLPSHLPLASPRGPPCPFQCPVSQGLPVTARFSPASGPLGEEVVTNAGDTGLSTQSQDSRGRLSLPPGPLAPSRGSEQSGHGREGTRGRGSHRGHREGAQEGDTGNKGCVCRREAGEQWQMYVLCCHLHRFCRGCTGGPGFPSPNQQAKPGVQLTQSVRNCLHPSSQWLSLLSLGRHGLCSGRGPDCPHTQTAPGSLGSFSPPVGGEHGPCPAPGGPGSMAEVQTEAWPMLTALGSENCADVGWQPCSSVLFPGVGTRHPAQRPSRLGSPRQLAARDPQAWPFSPPSALVTSHPGSHLHWLNQAPPCLSPPA